VLVAYVALHAVHALALRHLAVAGVSALDTMLYRGLGCVALAAGVGAAAGARLVPNRPGLQAARFVFSGFALWLVTAAYQYAHATTVTVISRLDTAILVALGPLVGVAASRTQRLLALGAIGGLVAFVGWGGGGAGESALGYALALGGTLGVTMGYLLLRSSAKTENDHVVALVAGLAIMGYGLAGRLVAPAASPGLDAAALGVALAAGAMMYGLYQLTVQLYRRMDITLAEYPTLFAALLVMPAEALLFATRFDALYVAAMIANVALVGGILALKPKAGA
jgi:drug/metabolite transporter (DMT)-like permease